MITGLVIAISAGLWAGVRLSKWINPPEHEPRALQLRLPDPNAHTCSYARVKSGDGWITMCQSCRRPPPTLIPGPGVSRLG